MLCICCRALGNLKKPKTHSRSTAGRYYHQQARQGQEEAERQGAGSIEGQNRPPPHAGPWRVATSS